MQRYEVEAIFEQKKDGLFECIFRRIPVQHFR